MPSFGQLHEEQLRQNRPDMYRELKRSGELESYLDAFHAEAREMHALLVKQLAERHPYTPEEWKNNREAWEGWLERTAREFVLHDLVLVPDPETAKAVRNGYTD